MILPKSRPEHYFADYACARPIHRQQCKLSEWDSGSRYVATGSYTSGEAIDYVRVSTKCRPGRADQFEPRIWCCKRFGLCILSVRAVTMYYAMTDHDLRRVDLGAKSVSAPLISQVESYVSAAMATTTIAGYRNP